MVDTCNTLYAAKHAKQLKEYGLPDTSASPKTDYYPAAQPLVKAAKGKNVKQHIWSFRDDKANTFWTGRIMGAFRQTVLHLILQVSNSHAGIYKTVDTGGTDFIMEDGVLNKKKIGMHAFQVTTNMTARLLLLERLKILAEHYETVTLAEYDPPRAWNQAGLQWYQDTPSWAHCTLSFGTCGFPRRPE